MDRKELRTGDAVYYFDHWTFTVDKYYMVGTVNGYPGDYPLFSETMRELPPHPRDGQTFPMLPVSSVFQSEILALYDASRYYRDRLQRVNGMILAMVTE